MKSLCLIKKSEVVFKDGATKIKHVFLDDQGKVYLGWSDVGQELSDEQICGGDEYKSARAHDYDVEVSEFDGKLRSKVILEV